MNRKLRILKLGWEFPPLYAGGLGPACYGLTDSLSRMANITLILPRAEKSFIMDNVKIIGLNHLQDERNPGQAATNASSEFTDESEQLPGVYPLRVEGKRTIWSRHISGVESKRLFDEKDIYGPSILTKVAAYSQLVKQIASTEEFDVIHAHDWITFPAAVQLKKLTGKPLVVHVHSLETDRVDTNSRNTVYEIEKTGMMQADYVFPVSKFTGQNIERYYDVNPVKIVPVYNGLDKEMYRNQSKNLNNKRSTEKKVLFLGRLTAQKGPEYLVETAKKLLRFKSNVKFYVAGTGDLKDHLEWLVQKDNLSEKFVFTGFLRKEEVKNLLAETDAYIMPSVSEPFGLSAVEAAQYDIPCVISRQSGAAEVLPNTLQADYWDTDKMAGYLYAALSYSALKDTLTEKTKENLSGINWDKSAQKVMHVYSLLLNRN